MLIPKVREVTEGAYAMDGGSIYLKLLDDTGGQHALILAQHRIPSSPTDKRKRGRLYLNDELIDVRSEDETTLLGLLRSATVRSDLTKGKPRESKGMIGSPDIKDYFDACDEGPETALRHLVAELLLYVESDEYVREARGGEAAT